MACGTCAKRQGRQTYLYTAPNGDKKVFSTEVEAKAAVARKGGTYRAQG
jgi:hypothetical protein